MFPLRITPQRELHIKKEKYNTKKLTDYDLAGGGVGAQDVDAGL